MTREERRAFIEDLLENTQKYKDQWTAEARLKEPQMTEEQLEWSWEQMAEQLGLPATKPARGPAKG
jgi:hypothetical protein